MSSTYPIKFGTDVIPHMPAFARRLTEPLAARVLGFTALNQLHSRSATKCDPHFCQRVLDSLDVRFDVWDTHTQRIPTSGPLVIVANHPFGGLDGLIMAALLRRVRPDVKLMGNFLLRAVPELHAETIHVDPFGGPDAARRSVAGLRAAVRWLKSGGALAVFPAGEVSRFEWRAGRVVDAPWNPSIARIIQSTRASVIPVFFEGRNRAIFQIGGLISPKIRTALLPRELLAKQGTRVNVRIGSTITPARIELLDPAQLTSYMRARTYVLGGLGEKACHRPHELSPDAERPNQEPIAEPGKQSLADEVAALPPARTLASNGPMRVIYATACEAPSVLHEIGRLREVAFRQVGEGTGKALDLDEFDQRYLHLFVWHTGTNQIIGAYRIGLTDRIVAEHGPQGLYTHTLFRYSRKLLTQIGPALELGRSFVRPEYQRDFAPLTLLWSGIARFVADHPRYKMLFGPVSISNEYSSMSKQLLMAFMRLNNYLPRLGRLIEPRNPPKLRTIPGWDPSLVAHTAQSLDDVDDLMREVEANGKGIPVLVRQYLKLRAKLLGFNVDPEFGDALDALVLVDLSNADRRFLLRYMGRERAAKFLDYHGMSLAGNGATRVNQPVDPVLAADNA